MLSLNLYLDTVEVRDSSSLGPTTHSEDSGEAERCFRRKSRTAFRDEPEHPRSVATLASRLCKKCSASSRKNVRSAAKEERR